MSDAAKITDPVTVEQLAEGLGLPVDDVTEYIELLIGAGMVSRVAPNRYRLLCLEAEQ